MGGGKCSERLKMLMSNRGKMAQNCWIFGAARRSDESHNLLLRFPVLRSSRSLQTSQTLRTIRTIRSIRLLNSIRSIRFIRSIRVLNSIHEIRVQKQNVGFVKFSNALTLNSCFMFSGCFMKKCVDGRLHERVRFSEKKWGESLGKRIF